MAVQDVARDDKDGWEQVKKLARRDRPERRVERSLNGTDPRAPSLKWFAKTPGSGPRNCCPNSSLNTEADIGEWSKGSTTHIPPFALVGPKFVHQLDIFQTEGCRSLRLETNRLILRQVEISDLPNIQKIKTEPTVQRTQLYGSPNHEECRDVFLNKYIRSSMPRISVMGGSKSRHDYIFAITMKKSSNLTLNSAAGLRLSNNLTSADGYLGNIGLSLETRGSSSLLPRPGAIYKHPTFEQCSKAKLVANMYYELHPQVWGLGLMSEAFGAVLRFAIEDVGCETVICNPTTSNLASVRLCEKHGLLYSHTDTDNEYRKPQAFYAISRKTWWSKNGLGGEMESRWAGKAVCRWCLNFQLGASVRCDGCEWAKYCSIECRRADWRRAGGHQSECN